MPENVARRSVGFQFLCRLPLRRSTTKIKPKLTQLLFHRSHRTSTVTLHGLGVAVRKVVDVANYVRQQHVGSLLMAANTSSIPVVDDYEPLVEGLAPISQIRFVSAIHITLTPTLPGPGVAK